MVGETRFRWLQAVGQDRLELGLPLGLVRELDRYLRSESGHSAIPHALGLVGGPGRRRMSLGLASKYRYLHDRQASYLERGKTIPADLETRFYDLIAERSLAGYVHSQKRPYILDTAALMHALINQLEVEGRVLDFGCHIGYHAHWLATQHPELSVQGVDLSREAIKVGVDEEQQGPEPRFLPRQEYTGPRRRVRYRLRQRCPRFLAGQAGGATSPCFVELPV